MIAIKKIEVVSIAAAVLIEPVLFKAGAYCNVTNEKYNATVKIRAKR